MAGNAHDPVVAVAMVYGWLLSACLYQPSPRAPLSAPSGTTHPWPCGGHAPVPTSGLVGAWTHPCVTNRAYLAITSRYAAFLVASGCSWWQTASATTAVPVSARYTSP